MRAASIIIIKNEINEIESVDVGAGLCACPKIYCFLSLSMFVYNQKQDENYAGNKSFSWDCDLHVFQ